MQNIQFKTKSISEVNSIVLLTDSQRKKLQKANITTVKYTTNSQKILFVDEDGFTIYSYENKQLKQIKD
jgi:hypothetical protein